MKRNKFSLSYTKLLSCDMGELIPCGLLEVLPGDTIRLNTHALIRCAPLVAPVMHPVHVRLHHWFVPHRLVWDDWENFITGGPDGLNNSVFPTITMPGGGGAVVGSLADYLGVPTGVNSLVVSALPFRGYQKIWNEWYRDQDLQTAAAVITTAGADATTSTALQTCAWEKDYFTSARPWEQKGATITVPLGTSAPVIFSESGATPGVRTLNRQAGATTPLQVVQAGTNTAPITAAADLSTATGVTVNVLRQSLALQRFQEARARYGSRYVEYLRYLGVRSSDARLHRPEYLGGGRQTVQFSEVLQTGPGTDPVGDLKGHGIAAMRSNRFQRFIEEHGYIHTFISVKPKTIYANGLFRTWNRRVKTDFWQKELQAIGQQAILNKEVYAAHGTPDGTFGYQDRYDDYRRMESSIAGEFRTSTLDFWHMARIFASAPALNSTFVACVPPERSFAVPSEDVLYCHLRHNIQARRLLNSTGYSQTF